jgi:hypothetical protein
MSRKEVSGYPRIPRPAAASAEAPKNFSICFVALGGGAAISGFCGVEAFANRRFNRKRRERPMRRIPRQKGNRPEPAIRKVPIGICRERMAVIPPKRKTIPHPISSSLFIFIPPLETQSPGDFGGRCHDLSLHHIIDDLP